MYYCRQVYRRGRQGKKSLTILFQREKKKNQWIVYHAKNLFFRWIFVCAHATECLWVYVQGSACTSECMYIGRQEAGINVFFHHFPFIIWTWNSAALTDQQAPGIPGSASPVLELQGCSTAPAFHMGAGVKLRTSCLSSKPFYQLSHLLCPQH